MSLKKNNFMDVAVVLCSKELSVIIILCIISLMITKLGLFGMIIGMIGVLFLIYLGVYMYWLKERAKEEEDNEGDIFGAYKSISYKVMGIEFQNNEIWEWVADNLAVGDKVNLRNEFENPEDKDAIAVIKFGHKIGYAPRRWSTTIKEKMSEFDIETTIIDKLTFKSNGQPVMFLKTYYMDPDGDEDLPRIPIEGSNIAVIETELWKDEENWSESWYLNVTTNELSYKFKDKYSSLEEFNECQESVGFAFISLVNNYIYGNTVTDKDVDKKLLENVELKTDKQKEVAKLCFMSYLKHRGYELKIN